MPSHRCRNGLLLQLGVAPSLEEEISKKFSRSPVTRFFCPRNLMMREGSLSWPILGALE